jgi:putative ABC transport system permease protein
MRRLWRDFAHGFRQLAATPVFTVTAILTLAVGIGANTAIFSLVNLLLFKPLSYAEPDRVVFTLGWDRQEQRQTFSLPIADIVDAAEVPSLQDSAAYQYWSAAITGAGMPVRAQAYRVTANTFDVLGVPAAIGRTLRPSDGRAGAVRVVVLSHGLWERQFGADANLVGERILLDGEPHLVVGVMPAGFEFPVFNFKGEAWTPLVYAPGTLRDGTPRGSAVGIARLTAGADVAAAQAELDLLAHRLAAEFPETNHSVGYRVVAMRELGAREMRPALYALFGAVAFVLLLACANLANLLLARGIGRQRELAIRAALGASRRQLVVQLVAEGLVLAVAGGVAGLLVAWLSLDLLRSALPDGVVATLPNILELGIDARTLLFTTVVSLATGIAFSLVPAFGAARPDLQDVLKQGGRATSGPAHRRFRGGLVAIQVALSLILLVGAGLMVRSFTHLVRLDPGFTPGGVLTLTVSVPEGRYPTPAAQAQFFERAEAELAALPGVVTVGAVNVLPFSTYNRGTSFDIEGRPLPDPDDRRRTAFRVATPGYFTAMGIRVLRGRGISRTDRADSEPVAIVNGELVRRYFGGADPIGLRLRVGGETSEWRRIVGVVASVRHDSLTEGADPEVYLPAVQAPDTMMMFALRSTASPESLAQSARAAMQRVDAEQPVFHVTTLERLVLGALAPQVIAAVLITLFGGIALFLAGVGIYGVMAYLARHDTHELGVRAALGAAPRDLMRLVIRRGAALVLPGIVIGIVGAAAGTRLLAGLLAGVTLGDPVTYATGLAILLGVAGIACYLPARRAMRTNPVEVLRAD